MVTTTRVYASRVQAGGCPREGQVVYLGAEASPQFASRPIRLLLVEDARPSAVDVAAQRPAATAQWLNLRGWEMDPKGRRLLERDVSAYARGIVIIHRSPAVQP